MTPSIGLFFIIKAGSIKPIVTVAGGSGNYELQAEVGSAWVPVDALTGKAKDGGVNFGGIAIDGIYMQWGNAYKFRVVDSSTFPPNELISNEQKVDLGTLTSITLGAMDYNCQSAITVTNGYTELRVFNNGVPALDYDKIFNGPVSIAQVAGNPSATQYLKGNPGEIKEMATFDIDGNQIFSKPIAF